MPNISMVITSNTPPQNEAGRLNTLVNFQSVHTLLDGQFSVGANRWILPSRLQSIETAYALTVHKSQGSDFDHVALVLPEEPSSILTRELLYTGITRARSFFTLADAGGRQVLKLAVERRMLRSGGSLF